MARLSSALFVFRAEFDTANPGRDRSSDGWISDARHAAKGYPTTKHSANPRGWVHAIDADKDGIDMARAIAVFERDPRSHLWIYNGQIALRREGWRRRRYTGANDHTKHGHFEDADAAWTETNTGAWGYATGGATLPVVLPTSGGGGGGMIRVATVRRNPTVVSPAVKQLQRAANKLGAGLKVDGKFGNRTRAWVLSFQRARGLGADGVVGAKTWCALGQAMLNRYGHGLTVDGKFGPKTRAAVIAVQRALGLGADGLFGPKTWAAVLR